MPDPFTLSRVIKVVGETLGYRHTFAPAPEIGAATLLVDDLHCDAIDIVCICVGIDEAFDIEITDDEAESWTCIADIARSAEARRPDKAKVHEIVFGETDAALEAASKGART